MNYNNSNSSSIPKDIIILAVRVFVGFAMLSHGYPKLQMLLAGGKIEFLIFWEWDHLLPLFSRCLPNLFVQYC